MSTISPNTGRPRPHRAARRRLVLRLLTVSFLGVLLVALPGTAEPAPDSARSVSSSDVAWQWPLRPAPNEVVHGFDPPADRWSSGHRGVDVRGGAGAAVHAARAGVVTFAGMLAGRGVVTVTHGALRTTYEPVTPKVAVGAHVAMGDVIAMLDLLGGHCLPRACLHWGLLRGDTYLNPLAVLGAGPVRLLPLEDGPATPGRRAPAAGPGDRSATTPVADPHRPSARASPPAVRTTRTAAGIGALTAAGLALAVQRHRSRRE